MPLSSCTGMFDTKAPKKNLAMIARGAAPKDSSYKVIKAVLTLFERRLNAV